MKNILIIGGNGFIGRNLCICLCKCGYNVFSFDIQYPDKKNKKINYIVGDFFDDQELEKSLENIDIVIHSLSTINPGNSNERYLQGYSRDFVQSVKLFDMCIKRNIKVIFLSSGGTIYGVQEKQPIQEDAITAPINHYGSVKLCIESVIKTFNRQQLHSNILIARISNPYGPGQDYNKGVGFVDAAIKKSIKNEPIEIWGNGEVIRDYVYIDDVCEMICSLITYNGELEVFNLSSNEGISLNNVIETLKAIGLNPQVIYKEARSVDVKKVILDNERIKSIHPMKIKNFKEGLVEYLKFLKEHN
ncbi:MULTISPECIES: NAD-dependent epimerase/dehydratase family protein [Coprobacillaceae]|uniref:NAD-dependent epimerase/dehydratase family protein n=1 Tax=Coprobacillaceae TaxID=2810280 RepID=UPI000E492036|nr:MULTISPECIES: NAD-dependent epimerase/dehydratase family protein [Coprobacillaceae]RHM59399.1 NAD-dependent epimerase/dehydratase family protein [Coprobacillus sp. AF33-1AC]RHS91754.1 NAD-dependent epimerase/dehydratase family protein [Erysipelatoclostridium sp. AM42-17]